MRPARGLDVLAARPNRIQFSRLRQLIVRGIYTDDGGITQ